MFGQHRAMKHHLIAALIALAASAQPIMAQPQSAYTDLVLERCRTVETFSEGGGARLACRGYRGIDVAVTEGDLRMYVSYGRNAANSCAALQTFGPFNSLGPKIEWRMGNGRPYATILRWYLDKGDGSGRKSWLVVTNLDGANSCHMAYVEGAVPNANQRAREAADLYARGFNCAADRPVVIMRTDSKVTDFDTAPCQKD